MKKYRIYATDLKNCKTPNEVENFIQKNYGLNAICGVTVSHIWFLAIDTKATVEQVHNILKTI